MSRWVWCTGKCESRFGSVLSGLRQSDGEEYCRGRDAGAGESVLLRRRYKAHFRLWSLSGISVTRLSDRWHFTCSQWQGLLLGCLSVVIHRPVLAMFKLCKGKEKERKSIYIAPFCTKVHTKRSGMDHTVLPANNTMPAFPSWRSPDVTTAATEAADVQLQLTTHLSTPKGWKAELA